MHTVVETVVFQKIWPNYWREDERGEFAAFIALNPNAGDVVPESGGIRKVRWGKAGSGKSGGVRVIYFVLNAREEIVLLTLYSKTKTGNLSGAQLKGIKNALEK
jgi:mRNA-degrading endonuclease RelE of RelBE toxin-antitoxin system